MSRERGVSGPTGLPARRRFAWRARRDRRHHRHRRLLTLSAGALIAVQGYTLLSGIGIEALTGFTSAYLNVRIIAPLVAGIGLAATIGAGATAQLGAMRINEEIDALEVIGVRTVAFLASTRLVAGVIVVIPLYCAAILRSAPLSPAANRICAA
jgi:ABC-type transporter Mla maintaining outer membrane lipid asymmetry permease subunit MlaE